MAKITEKIDKLLKEKNLSRYKLSKLINYKESTLNRIINGEQTISNNVIQKIAPILEVPQETIRGWILVDKYSKNIIEMALKVKHEMDQQADVLILTTKIDEALKNKDLSRTALSKVIDYSQGKLNQMIKGDEPISPLVISKIAPVLEISEDEIRSWIVADKYSIEALRVAIECKKSI